MKLNNTILRSYYWEGFEGELYQHCQRCMNLVEMGQKHSSVGELIWPSLSPLEGGDRYMHHSNLMGRTIGEEYAQVKQDYFYDYMHSSTLFMQAMTPRRRVLSCQSHGKFWAATCFT